MSLKPTDIAIKNTQPRTCRAHYEVIVKNAWRPMPSVRNSLLIKLLGRIEFVLFNHDGASVHLKISLELVLRFLGLHSRPNRNLRGVQETFELDRLQMRLVLRTRSS